MAPTYTRSFGTVRGATNQTLTFFTAPAGATWVLRDLVGYIGTSVAAYLQVYMITGSLVYVVWRWDSSTPKSDHLELRLVIPEGTSLVANSNAEGWHVSATGYRLAPQSP